MKITIDDREDNIRKETLKDVFPDECFIERLETGDIIIEQDGLPTVAIEVKTVDDYISSVKNNRLYDEIIRMKDKYPYSYVLVYGDWSEIDTYYNSYTVSMKNSSYYEVQGRYKTPIFCLPNMEEFVNMIIQIIKGVPKVNEPIDPPIVRKKDLNPFINVLIGINGVGKKTAQRLLDTFHTPGGVFNASREELEQIPRLKKKSIDEILRMGKNFKEEQ